MGQMGKVLTLIMDIIIQYIDIDIDHQYAVYFSLFCCFVGKWTPAGFEFEVHLPLSVGCKSCVIFFH